MLIDHQQAAPGDGERTAGVLEIVTSRLGPDLTGVRVLDLACRTGAFAAAFAAAGADVTGVEGRAENLAMAYPGPRYVHGDVRDVLTLVGADQPGERFDVTLCLGILYHLGVEDAVRLLRDMRTVTAGFAIIDTHIGAPVDEVEADGHTYAGQWYGEPPGLWSSIGNRRSWWFTPDALDDACRNAGWNVEHHPGIRWHGEPAGRVWRVLS